MKCCEIVFDILESVVSSIQYLESVDDVEAVFIPTFCVNNVVKNNKTPLVVQYCIY